MIIFKLEIPGLPSYGKTWAKCYRENSFSKEKREEMLAHKCYFYRWEDGWCANVLVEKGPRIKTDGFRGYDWMVDSIIEHGEIRRPSRTI